MRRPDQGVATPDQGVATTVGRAVRGGPVLSVLLVLLAAAPASAVYLDNARNFSLRARAYTQVGVATQNSEKQTVTPIRRWDVVSNRFFFNPEFDANLNPFLGFLKLDELKFRLALWGFYEPVYEYLNPKWRRAKDGFQGKLTRGRTSTAPITGNAAPIDPVKIYSYQPDPTLGNDGLPGDIAEIPFRFNEAYLNFTKGRYSFRVGRQAISWGESDSIALLDQSNPFDVTRAVPGVLQDVDEARIPLWTLRSQVRLFDSWGPFSSGFLDMYWVPGTIDTAVSPVPISAGVSPYSPPEGDPQEFVDVFASIIPEDFRFLLDDVLGGLQFVQYDHQPSRSLKNSRFGFRLESVINRDYTANVWFYRTLSQIPVPRFLPLDLSRTALANPDLPLGSGPAQLITETVHRHSNVFGGSLSFYNQLVNGIIRINTQFFLNEPAFIPRVNIPFEALMRQPALKNFLGDLGVNVPDGPIQGHVPKADFLRWEVGYDRFFFNRVLNPSNSFVWVTSFVGSWNTSETFSNKDYRFYGQRKLSPNEDEIWRVGVNIDEVNDLEDVPKLHTVNKDYVDLHPVEWFVQSTLQTDYFHGRLTPRFTAVINGRGTYVLSPSVDFRYSDRLLLSVKYAAFMGGFFQTGFFRDRDQLLARLTFFLN